MSDSDSNTDVPAVAVRTPAEIKALGNKLLKEEGDVDAAIDMWKLSLKTAMKHCTAQPHKTGELWSLMVACRMNLAAGFTKKEDSLSAKTQCEAALDQIRHVRESNEEKRERDKAGGSGAHLKEESVIRECDALELKALFRLAQTLHNLQDLDMAVATLDQLDKIHDRMTQYDASLPKMNPAALQLRHTIRNDSRKSEKEVRAMYGSLMKKLNKENKDMSPINTDIDDVKINALKWETSAFNLTSLKWRDEEIEARGGECRVRSVTHSTSTKTAEMEHTENESENHSPHSPHSPTRRRGDVYLSATDRSTVVRSPSLFNSLKTALCLKEDKTILNLTLPLTILFAICEMYKLWAPTMNGECTGINTDTRVSDTGTLNEKKKEISPRSSRSNPSVGDLHLTAYQINTSLNRCPAGLKKLLHLGSSTSSRSDDCGPQDGSADSSKLTIHVIGARGDTEMAASWKAILERLPKLACLQVILVGFMDPDDSWSSVFGKHYLSPPLAKSVGVSQKLICRTFKGSYQDFVNISQRGVLSDSSHPMHPHLIVVPEPKINLFFDLIVPAIAMAVRSNVPCLFSCYSILPPPPPPLGADASPIEPSNHSQVMGEVASHRTGTTSTNGIPVPGVTHDAAQVPPLLCAWPLCAVPVLPPSWNPFAMCVTPVDARGPPHPPNEKKVDERSASEGVGGAEASEVSGVSEASKPPPVPAMPLYCGRVGSSEVDEVRLKWEVSEVSEVVEGEGNGVRLVGSQTEDGQSRLLVSPYRGPSGKHAVLFAVCGQRADQLAPTFATPRTIEVSEVTKESKVSEVSKVTDVTDVSEKELSKAERLGEENKLKEVSRMKEVSERDRAALNSLQLDISTHLDLIVGDGKAPREVREVSESGEVSEVNELGGGVSGSGHGESPQEKIERIFAERSRYRYLHNIAIEEMRERLRLSDVEVDPTSI
eukprot:GHVN01085759.1.p1 GENE.GHVN01085759.1~~GHVN01085759.1.p1  ORF type:complete len:941 (-),score=288.71 GHVN01085759.1:388-3210(-)